MQGALPLQQNQSQNQKIKELISYQYPTLLRINGRVPAWSLEYDAWLSWLLVCMKTKKNSGKDPSLILLYSLSLKKYPTMCSSPEPMSSLSCINIPWSTNPFARKCMNMHQYANHAYVCTSHFVDVLATAQPTGYLDLGPGRFGNWLYSNAAGKGGSLATTRDSGDALIRRAPSALRRRWRPIGSAKGVGVTANLSVLVVHKLRLESGASNIPWCRPTQKTEPHCNAGSPGDPTLRKTMEAAVADRAVTVTAGSLSGSGVTDG